MMDSTEALADLNRALRGTLALVLAGGRGSRLRNLTDNEAKPAVPFAGKFRIIDFPLSNCVNSGIRRIAVPTQYKAHTLIQHLQRGWGFFRAEINEFVELWPAQQQTLEESWYRGTADAVFQNLELVRRHDPEYILILAGDHVYRQDYSKLLAYHIDKGADVTISCVEVPLDKASDFGVVAVDDNDDITGFLEKPTNPPHAPGNPNVAFASMGIYVFNTQFLIGLLEKDAQNPDSAHDFGKDIIPALINSNRVVAHRFNDSCVLTPGATEPYWRDVGTVDAYWEANLDLTTITPELDLYDEEWPIWTYQLQKPAAKFVFDSDDRRGMAVDSVVSAGCVISGATVRRSLLFSCVRINSYALVEDSVVLPDTDIGRHCRIHRAIIGAGCKVPEGLVVGENREEDQRRFHVTEKGVTLVTRQMLEALG
jgi:glucose-1-phosphate adenylyltransferase